MSGGCHTRNRRRHRLVRRLLAGVVVAMVGALPAAGTAHELDVRFGDGGMHAVALQRDAKVVAVGASEADFALARFFGAG